MYTTNVLVLGATFLGIGYAAAHKDSIIIERGENPGPDFIGSADIAPINVNASHSYYAAALVKELEKRNLLDRNGNVHIYPVSGVMSKFVLDNKIQLIMDTRVVSIDKTSDGFDVTVFSLNGFDTIHSKKILDTGAICKLKPKKSGFKKYVSASVLGGGEEFDTITDSGLKIRHGLHGQSVLSMTVDADCSYTEARLKLHEFLSKNIKNSKIASFASEFMYEYNEIGICKNIAENYLWVPSCSYQNLLAAFEAGINMSE